MDERGHCARCGYSLVGLAPSSGSDREAVFLCPECSHEGPASAGKRSLGRAILLTVWRGAVVVVGMFLLLVGVLMAVQAVTHSASLPFRELLANSDLVTYGRGEIGADLDRNQWSEELAREMFLESGGWSAALRFATIAILLGCAVASAFAGWIVAWGLCFLRSWMIGVMVIVVVMTAWWLSIFFIDARVASSSVRYYASTQSIVKVGPLVAAMTSFACLCGLLIGARLRRRGRPPIR